MSNNRETIRIPTIQGNKVLQQQIKSEFAPMPPQAMLTEKEELFCQLFSNGGKRFAGNQVETYKQVFGDKENNKLMIESNKLLTSPAVTSRIKDIMTNKMENESYAKVRVLETLFAIMDETREAKYKDKWGVSLSPAPLRAVSVNAAKAIADIYAFKAGGETGVTINGENNVTFNVIVPNKNV